MPERSGAIQCAIVVAGALASLVVAAPAHAELVYGVTQTQTLVTWDSAMPGTLASGTAISGLQSNETIRGIDFRPATGQLYAVGSTSRLYGINISTGQATQIGPQFSTLLNGSSFGFDFNPQIDRIRVVSNQNQNLVLNPDTGAVQLVATPLFYPAGDANSGGDPNVVHSAYTNNFPGTTSTQLYGIDTERDILVTQANNTGVLGTVGSIGADINVIGGFDISGATGTAYAVTMNAAASQSTFWGINLSTGAGSFLGTIGGGEIITAMSVQPVPGPGVLAGLAMSLVAMPRRRRMA